MKSNLLRYGLLLIGIVSVMSIYAFRGTVKEEDTVVAEKGIQFIEQDWTKALQQAKTENKLIFIDIYTTWCGPCKMMKNNTFSDEKVGEFFNKNFINISVDGEKTVGPELASKFAIQGYPSLIVTDANGKAILYFAGYLNAEQFMSFAKQALSKKS